MKYLLDVNVLLAAIWSNHSRHSDAFNWLHGKEVAVCPISELGFLRISTNKKALNAPMEMTRELLQEFLKEREAERVPDDLAPLDSRPMESDQVTDHYLADLAARHSLKLATLDESIGHLAVEVIGRSN